MGANDRFRFEGSRTRTRTRSLGLAASSQHTRSQIRPERQMPRGARDRLRTSHYIAHVTLTDCLMPVSFGNSAMNDLYTADTPRA